MSIHLQGSISSTLKCKVIESAGGSLHCPSRAALLAMFDDYFFAGTVCRVGRGITSNVYSDASCTLKKSLNTSWSITKLKAQA